MTDELLDAVRQRLARSGAAPTPAGVAAALRAQGRLLGDAEVLGARQSCAANSSARECWSRCSRIRR